jgi:hypothetical protein
VGVGGWGGRGGKRGGAIARVSERRRGSACERESVWETERVCVCACVCVFVCGRERERARERV